MTRSTTKKKKNAYTIIISNTNGTKNTRIGYSTYSINNKKLLYRTYLYLVSQVQYSIPVFVISYALTI